MLGFSFEKPDGNPASVTFALKLDCAHAMTGPKIANRRQPLVQIRTGPTGCQEVLAMNKPDDSKAKAIAEARRQNNEALKTHPIVTQEEWIRKRLELLAKEKEYVRAGDALAAEVRALPWVKVDKPYTFTSAQGDLSLADLFGRHSQLFLKHFMMEPEQQWQCEGCTLESNHVDPLLPYFENHDMAYVAVSRAPIDQIEVVRKRMGWKFCWVSSYKSDFNYDFHVSFRPDEVKAGKTVYNFREKKIGPETYTLSGHSVFYKTSSGEVFRTYGTFDRGGEQFMGVYGYFDVLPKGREEYHRGLTDWAQVQDYKENKSEIDDACGCSAREK
jgi:predicted dithiol-disulfide oxidoreductase (DUF899 family)